MDIHDTLDEAIGILENGRPRAFGGGVVVDRDQLLQLLHQAHATLPDEVLAAAAVLAQRKQLIDGAEAEAQALAESASTEAQARVAAATEEAQSIRDQAEVEAAALRETAEAERAARVADHEVLREAQERADLLLERAQQRTAAMRAEVDAYVDAKLAAIATTLGKALDTVEAGRSKVRAGSEPAPDAAISLA